MSLSFLFSGLFAAPSARADQQVVYLSSLDLSKAVQGFGTPQADKSVDGNPITLGGHVYQRGFGTHSNGALEIKLAGGTKEFIATVGVDDETGTKGSVEFRVVGDGGKVLWASGTMRGGDPAKQVDVDLSGSQTAVLQVTDAGDGYEFDHAVWADARFVVSGVLPQTVDLAQGPPPVIALAAPPRSPEIHFPRVASGRPGQPFLFAVPATGDAPLKFAAKGLPRGLALDSATGEITGSVADAGKHNVAVSVSNSAGKSAEQLEIVISDTLALTPPMGWNSYDCFGDSVTEKETLANAQFLHDHMKAHGWQYVIVDYRWYDPLENDVIDRSSWNGRRLSADNYGRLVPAVDRFPSSANGVGFKALADKVHAMGLKFGVHIMRGIPRQSVEAKTPIQGSSFTAADAADIHNTCGWCPDMYGVDTTKPAGQAWYDSILRQYAAWNLDYIKVDDLSSPYSSGEIEAIRKAIDKCGRPIIFSTSPGETPVDQAKHVSANANMWRISGDFWDNWGAVDHNFDLLNRWSPIGGPGHFPDADMLPVGHVGILCPAAGSDHTTHLTKNEQVTMLTLWCIAPSPLMVGAHLPDNDAWTTALLTNDDVIAIDQDSLGAKAVRVRDDGTAEVWSRKLADGSLAVALFNRGSLPSEVGATWTDLGLTGSHNVRNLWERRDMGAVATGITAAIGPHGAQLFRVN